MPSNNISVNHMLSFEVNDLRMDEFMEWLRLNSWFIGDLPKGEEETTGVCHNLEQSSDR